ncbi:YqzH family protein [Fictibacillus sp. Mic-4]|uniref:YqzH family protein n=1 Tax=Fictibacillus TaxID=1329200 RepID=UPI000420E9EC|nr:YqzH family protein [Fictibacillus gelatini]
MDDKLLEKMIKKSLLQYFGEFEEIPLSDKDYRNLVEKIQDELPRKEEEIHMIIEDIVYEFLTN